MKKLLPVILIAGSFLGSAQEDLQTSLNGKWLMVKVIQDGEDVSEKHNPENNRFFIFNDDNSFESGGDPYGKNTGKFFIDQGQSRLMIDSDQGAGDDSMWKIEFKDNQMIWTGIGSDWNSRFSIVHEKASED